MRKASTDSILDPVSISGESHALKCELAAEVLRSTGRLTLKVTGSSMLPSVFPGDTLIIERADLSATQNGDILIIGRDGRLLAHRLMDTVTSSDRAAALTKGDALTYSDPVAEDDKVLGKVSLVVRNGKAVQPRRKLRLAERTVAALVRRSELATRLIMAVHNLRASGSERPSS